MSDEAGAAPAAAESAPASAPELPLDTPSPIATDDQGHPPDAKPESKPKEAKEPAKPPTIKDSLDKARTIQEKEAKAEVKDTKEVKTEKADTKPAEKVADKTPEKPRDETGKFVAKEGDKPEAKPETKPSFTSSEPPARFTQAAKERWAETHESVRGETERAISELTKGYEKYKASAERDASLNEFHEMAKSAGKDLPSVLRSYVNMENHLRQDLVGGLEQICAKVGVSLKDVAAKVMGQTPDQTASQQDATIRDLNAKIERLEQQVGSVSQTFQQQQTAHVGKEVAEFAASHTRFEELSEDIAFFLKSGRTTELSEAYKLAERLNPAPAEASKPPAASSAPVIDLSAQIEKGQKSTNGAPSAGSSPAARKPSPSIKDSLKQAFATTR